MTVLQLKNLCKDRGLRISGNKSEVVIRLMEDDESKTAPVQQILHQPQVEMMQQQMEEMKKIMRANAAADMTVERRRGIAMAGNFLDDILRNKKLEERIGKAIFMD